MSYNKAVVKWYVRRVLGFLNKQNSLTYLNQLFDILISHSLSVSVPIRAKISTPHPLPSRSRGKFFTSLRCRHNLTPVSSVCQLAPISLFWASQQTQQITGNAFWISLQPDWQIDNGIFEQANHSVYSIPGTQVRAQSKGFGAVSQMDSTRSLVPSVAQASFSLVLPCYTVHVYCWMKILVTWKTYSWLFIHLALVVQKLESAFHQ